MYVLPSADNVTSSNSANTNVEENITCNSTLNENSGDGILLKASSTTTAFPTAAENHNDNNNNVNNCDAVSNVNNSNEIKKHNNQNTTSHIVISSNSTPVNTRSVYIGFNFYFNKVRFCFHANIRV